MRKQIMLLLAPSLVAIVIAYVMTNSARFGLCAGDAYSCREVFNRIGDPLFYGMIALSIIFIVLLFVPLAFKSWKKFAIWFVPLTAVVFAIYKGPGGGFMDPSPQPQHVYIWFCALYILISLIIIAVSVYKARGRK